MINKTLESLVVSPGSGQQDWSAGVLLRCDVGVDTRGEEDGDKPSQTQLSSFLESCHPRA